MEASNWNSHRDRSDTVVSVACWMCGSLDVCGCVAHWMCGDQRGQDLIVQMNYSEPGSDDELAQGHPGSHASPRQETVSAYFCIMKADVAEMPRKLMGPFILDTRWFSMSYCWRP